MKTTKEMRQVIRESAEWEINYQAKTFREVPTSTINSAFCISLLDDIEELETRLSRAEALLERAMELLTYGWIPDGGEDHEWLKDYEELRKR